MKKAAATIGVPLLAAVLAWVFCPAPPLDGYVPYSSAYLDRDGRLLRLTLAEDQRYRLYYPLEEIAPAVVEATILYEDQDFYRHPGVDPLALLRAAWATWVSRERRIGASTIAMQVARMKWRIESSSIGGKLEQIARALQLMRHHSRDEVLEMYLNLAPYGRNIEGVGAASRIYFGKTPAELSLPEALTLAVIPQNPNRRDPTSASGYQRLRSARANLLQRWLESHPGDAAQAKFFDLPLQVNPPEELPFAAPHFVDFVARERPRWEHGSLRTTLDLDKQRSFEKILHEYVERRGRDGIHNGAALLLNHRTMAIEAMVGSADFFDAAIFGQVNGTLAKRSPGSTLKPFVYALALDDGLVHPLSLLKDAPRRFGGFTPENYDKRFLGPVSVKQALIQSRNVPAVDLQSRLKTTSFHRFLLDAGIKGLREESYYGLALALGGGELTMLELASLYAGLANHGRIRPPRWRAAAPVNAGKPLLSAEASYLVLDMLKDNPPPDGRLRNGRQVAWKTGTSWAFRDAWAIGVSGPWVIAVWIGNFDAAGNRAFSGRRAAGPLLFSLFDAISGTANWRVDDLYAVDELNLKRLQVCATTGDLYEADCPAKTDSWFIPGVSPIRVTDIYRRIPVDIDTGLRACWHRPGTTEMRLFEFWPSDYLRVFNRAGISLKTPPRFARDCELDYRGDDGHAPVITSPQQTVEYIVSRGSPGGGQVPFEATVDADTTRVYWFVDDVFVGASRRGETLFWNAVPGRYEARVVDDLGRAANQRFVVSQVN